MKYHVVLKKSVQKELKSLPPQIVNRIFSKLRELEQNPLPAGYVQLTDFAMESFKYEKLYRIRVGDYRVIYAIENETITITVLRIRHRKEVYK
jgi:mRNA interferase RelE/StbE